MSPLGCKDTGLCINFTFSISSGDSNTYSVFKWDASHTEPLNSHSHMLISRIQHQFHNTSVPLTFPPLVTAQQEAKPNAKMVSFTTPRKGDCHSNLQLPW